MITAAPARSSQCRRTAAALITALLALAMATPAARAGDWMQVSCVNPDGSAAPYGGWSSTGSGAGYGSNNAAVCTPGSPMTAILSTDAAVGFGAEEVLQYTPPPGSTLTGGTVDVSLRADGGGYNASGVAALYEPAFAYDGSDVFFQCAWGLSPCENGTNDYSGELNLPADRGGDFYAAATCGGDPGETCNEDGSNGAWAEAQVTWAHLLLNSAATPQATDFSGSALQPGARGTAHLVLTATDPGGPGIYTVSTAIDGTTVWSGTPNTNGGECVPVGTDPASGALMFDYQQPCPATDVVDVPVPTIGFSDGSHELTVTVTDAAQNSSVVLDQTITTSNPQVTPAGGGRGGIRAEFVISWTWSGRHTRLRSISVRHLPANARLAVSCAGAGCPRVRIRSEPARHAGRLLRGLAERRLTEGDRLELTVTAPHRRAERIQLQIRDNRAPVARLLRR
jgi:hypothetical protein